MSLLPAYNEYSCNRYNGLEKLNTLRGVDGY